VFFCPVVEALKSHQEINTGIQQSLSRPPDGLRLLSHRSARRREFRRGAIQQRGTRALLGRDDSARRVGVAVLADRLALADSHPSKARRNHSIAYGFFRGGSQFRLAVFWTGSVASQPGLCHYCVGTIDDILSSRFASH